MPNPPSLSSLTSPNCTRLVNNKVISKKRALWVSAMLAGGCYYEPRARHAWGLRGIETLLLGSGAVGTSGG